MKAAEIGIFLAVVIFVLTILTLGLYSTPRTRTPITDCKRTFADISLRMYAIKEETNGGAQERMPATSGLELNSALARLLTDEATRTGIRQPSYVERNLLRDPWQRPFNVAWRSALTNLENEYVLLFEGGDIAIWSSGPNGTNEYGAGDDLVGTGLPVRKP
jgi:hypothetical protein